MYDDMFLQNDRIPRMAPEIQERSPQPPTSASAMYIACAAARLIVDIEDACFYNYDAFDHSVKDGNVTMIFTKRRLGRQGVAGESGNKPIRVPDNVFQPMMV
ncbi:unnamed protein product [Clonostachys rosea f. rosea IK726]|uniref:Uncharacterized protein n=1 Tax=Clonostachys rosea f. rosea IK726 TaxID=1349383 RepID=A0ACA9T9M3_BIOOC|nr:unnamed protein product [Clonostachys rosea f. rosea IK726]